MLTYLLALILLGILWPSEEPLWDSYVEILKAPGMLITDYFAVGGIPPTLINAGVVGLIGLFLIYISKTSLSGPTIAGVFTMVGFALFGKTPINIWPVIAGVACSAYLKGQKFRSYIVVALFGTALGPVVTQIAYGLDLSYGIGVLAGLGTGLLLPAMASHVLHNHQGFNLYNVGFTCGLMGMYVTALLKWGGKMPEMAFLWHTEDQLPLAVFFSCYFGLMIILGWQGRKASFKLWKLPGTLVSDFVSEEGMKATLCNMGVVGLIGMAYIALVGGEYNGPTLGGVFTMVGFAAFGKHAKNIWPLMAGVFLASLLSPWSAGEPGVVLAALFGTTLAPIAGGFGPLIGLLAGMVHLAVVMHVGEFHAGLNLYNNGFAGGLVGTLFISVHRWFQNNQT